MPEADGSSPAGRPAVRHRALLYRGEDEFVARGAAFAREGLEAGDGVLVVVPARKLALLREALGRDGDGVQLEDATARYARLGPMFTSFLRYLDRHARPEVGRVRVLAEQSISARPAEQARAYLRYEAVANVAYAPYDADVLCPYDVAALPPELIEGARRTHPELIEEGRLGRSRWFTDPAAFIGETERRRPLSPPQGPWIELASPLDLAGARRFLEAEGEGAGVDPSALADLLLAAHEMAINGLEHGGGAVTIHAWAEGRSFRCQLSDPGGGLREPFAGYLPPPPGAGSGRGLWLAHQLCDLVEVSAGPQGTTVRLHAAR